MILYNVTVGIDRNVELDWFEWMTNNHIPKVMSTGFFNEFKIFKVLSHEDENTVSYSIQYFSDSLEKVEIYLAEFAPDLAEEHMLRYKDRHVAFRTLLQQL